MNEVTAAIEKINRYKQTDHDTYKCSECDAEFPTPQGATIHHYRKHDPASANRYQHSKRSAAVEVPAPFTPAARKPGGRQPKRDAQGNPIYARAYYDPVKAAKSYRARKTRKLRAANKLRRRAEAVPDSVKSDAPQLHAPPTAALRFCPGCGVNLLAVKISLGEA